MTSLLLFATLAANVFEPPRPSWQPAGPTTLTIGESAAQAGAEVVAPLTLVPAEGMAIGSVTVRLTYPTALLSFVKVEPSGLALGVEAEVESKVEAGPDPKSATLQIKISTAPGSGQALPRGPLVYLRFKISETAKPQTSIAIGHTAAALTSGEPRQPVPQIVAGKAVITVARPPVPACFFYMH